MPSELEELSYFHPIRSRIGPIALAAFTDRFSLSWHRFVSNFCSLEVWFAPYSSNYDPFPTTRWQRRDGSHNLFRSRRTSAFFL